ncbi:MAG TPA: hypothetical protein VJY62_15965, partial [Bacteroidia bacterium]|nr:hypothetical protein [Bacteroidia bacterium]
HKKTFERDFVFCERQSEKEFLAENILQVFPALDKQKVEKAINECCLRLTPPRARQEFIEFLKKELNV